MTTTTRASEPRGILERACLRILRVVGFLAGVLSVTLAIRVARDATMSPEYGGRFLELVLAILLGALSWVFTVGEKFPRTTLAIRCVVVALAVAMCLGACARDEGPLVQPGVYVADPSDSPKAREIRQRMDVGAHTKWDEIELFAYSQARSVLALAADGRFSLEQGGGESLMIHDGTWSASPGLLTVRRERKRVRTSLFTGEDREYEGEVQSPVSTHVVDHEHGIHLEKGPDGGTLVLTARK